MSAFPGGAISRRLMCLVIVVCTAVAAMACQVPVFRYALERWPADPYEIVVLHAGELSSADRARVDALRNGAGALSNCIVRTVDVEGDLTNDEERAWREMWQEQQASPESSVQPMMALLYPRNAHEIPNRIVDVVPFNADNVEHLFTSPVRQQVVDAVLSGESAVWIFVPSGKEELDKPAEASLNEHVELNEKQLELPPQEEIEADEFYQPSTQVELRLGFSVVTLDRNDPREAWLLKQLMGSESDLKQLDQPMAFPVLGRGRVLYALVGKGIMPETIGMASRFVVGPCSCQVKEQNPGFDLLLSVDWDKRLGTSPALSKPLPALPTEPVLLSIPPGKKARTP